LALDGTVGVAVVIVAVMEVEQLTLLLELALSAAMELDCSAIGQVEKAMQNGLFSRFRALTALGSKAHRKKSYATTLCNKDLIALRKRLIRVC